MKTTSKIAARRIIQGGAAFAALGALSIATALPAAAEPVAGWAYASSNGGNGFIETQEGTVNDSFSVDYGWVSWSGTSTASVTADGVLASVEVPSVRVQITVKDAENGLPTEEDETEEDTDSSEEPTEDPEGDADAGEGEGDADADAGAGEGDEDADADAGEGDDAEPAPTTPPADEVEPTEEPSPSPSAEDADTDADASVVTLDETNSETVAESDEILVEATISGITVSTFKSWDGSVDHNVNPGTVSDITAPEGVEFTITPDIYEWEQPTEFEGYVWDDAYSVLDYDFVANGELVQYVTIAETGVGTLTLDEGETPDPGEEKPRPEKPVEKPEADDKKPVAKPSEALATTGSPIGGLIAAGAAIAAGGGAAAYFARRKKTAVEAPAEQGDN